MSDTFDYAPAGALRAAEADLKKWRDNVEFMLDDGDPDVIRAHEGGGAEDLIMSLVLTLTRTRAQRDIAMGIAQPSFASGEEETPDEDPEVVALRESIPWSGSEPSDQLRADYARYYEVRKTQARRQLTPLIGEARDPKGWHGLNLIETLRAGVYYANRLGNKKTTDAVGDDLLGAAVERLITAGWKPPR